MTPPFDVTQHVQVSQRTVSARGQFGSAGQLGGQLAARHARLTRAPPVTRRPRKLAGRPREPKEAKRDPGSPRKPTEAQRGPWRPTEAWEACGGGTAWSTALRPSKISTAAAQKKK